MAVDIIGPDITALPLQGFKPEAGVPSFSEPTQEVRDIPESVWLSYDHRALAIAASAVAASCRPVGERLATVQDDVSNWVTEKLASGQPESVSTRIRGLVGYLHERHIGSVGLFDLDATEALIDKLEAQDREEAKGIIPPEVLPPRGLLEDAPALAYVKEEHRRAFAEGLPEAYFGSSSATTTSVVKDKSLKIECPALPQFGLRNARARDIAEMVEVDLRAFGGVYKGEGYAGIEELRASKLEMFTRRFKMLGGKWMPVVTRLDETGKEKIFGFMVACPTSKRPDDFVSWEKMTDDGMLTSLYDPKGKNMYIVTLSMDPSVRGEHGQDQLYARQVANLVERGVEVAFFESRLPGLRSWVKKKCPIDGLEFANLTDANKMTYAERYAFLTREVKGRKVPVDSLLRLYTSDFGCKVQRVVPEAYKDEPSMNFGVLYTFENPLRQIEAIPSWIRNSKIAGKIVGKALALVSKSTDLTNRLMKLM